MTDQATRPVRRALLSVSDKTGIVELARALADAGVALLSTGGTFRTLESAGVPVTEVSAHTGFPEMMDGRVKTLHPKVHGGILGRRGVDDRVMADHHIAPIDLVVVNLYPFAETVAREDCTFELAIENIDIGGPAMVRSAAKNHADVLVVVDPADYPAVSEAVAAGGSGYEQRKRLAAKAFRHTARYDAMVSGYLGADQAFPESLTLTWDRLQEMRYGENPHQAAAFYAEGGNRTGTIAGLKQLQGKALSYNNVADTDAALECVKVFDDPACVIVKHANPCGVAEAEDLGTAYDLAFATDPTSAFGGIIAFNRPLDATTPVRGGGHRSRGGRRGGGRGAEEEERAASGMRSVRTARTWPGAEARGRRSAGAECRRAVLVGLRPDGDDRTGADGRGDDRSGVRLEGRLVREVQRHRLREEPADRGGGCRSDGTGDERHHRRHEGA